MSIELSPEVQHPAINMPYSDIVKLFVKYNLNLFFHFHQIGLLGAFIVRPAHLLSEHFLPLQMQPLLATDHGLESPTAISRC